MFDIIDTLADIVVYTGTLDQCELQSYKLGGSAMGYVICQHGEKPDKAKPLVTVKPVEPPTVLKEPDQVELF